jgi:3-dehydroquinate synthase
LPDPERQKIIRTLRAFELPTTLPADFPKKKILEAIRFDKKFTQGAVRFVIASAIGTAHLSTDVTMDDLEAAVAKL